MQPWQPFCMLMRLVGCKTDAQFVAFRTVFLIGLILLLLCIAPKRIFIQISVTQRLFLALLAVQTNGTNFG